MSCGLFSSLGFWRTGLSARLLGYRHSPSPHLTGALPERFKSQPAAGLTGTAFIGSWEPPPGDGHSSFQLQKHHGFLTVSSCLWDVPRPQNHKTAAFLHLQDIPSPSQDESPLQRTNKNDVQVSSCQSSWKTKQVPSSIGHFATHIKR